MKNIILKPGANTITLDNFESVNGCRINAIEVLCSTDCTVTFTLNCEGFAAAHQIASVSVSSGRGFATLTDTYLSLGDIITVSGAPSSAYIHCFSFASAEDTSSPPAPTDNFLTFTAEQAGSTLVYDYTGSNVMIRRNDGTWTPYTSGTSVTLAAIGETIQFKGNLTKAGYFAMEGRIAASGSVTSLLDGKGINPSIALEDECFMEMFTGCEALTAAPELPSMALSVGCYTDMFMGCTSLTVAPDLPATVMVDTCYLSMFYDCSSLKTAPTINATILAEGCFGNMFQNCSSLKISENGGVGKIILNIPSGTHEEWGWNEFMFTDTGGTFTGDPQVGVKYYNYQ